jgi:hypothetical protein
MIAQPMLPMIWLNQCSAAKIGLVRKKNQPQSIEEPVDVFLVLVAADGGPFLGPGEEAAVGGDGRSGRKAEGGLHRLCLEDAALRVELGHGLEGRAGIGDERRHPVVIGKAEPAAIGDLFDLRGRALTRVEIEFLEILVAQFHERAIEHADHPLVEDEEILEIGRAAVAGDDAIGREADRGRALVLDRLAHGEHVIGVDADFAAENQSRAIVPNQRDGALRRQRSAVLDRPERVGTGDLIGRETRAGSPAVQRVIGRDRTDGIEQVNGIGVGVDRLAVVLEHEIVDPPPQKRDRARQAGRVDLEAGRFGGCLGCDIACARHVGCARRCRGCGGRETVLRHGRIGIGGGGFGRWEQDEPQQDHEKAERCRENEVLVLLIHGPEPSVIAVSPGVQQSAAPKVKRFPGLTGGAAGIRRAASRFRPVARTGAR